MDDRQQLIKERARLVSAQSELQLRIQAIDRELKQSGPISKAKQARTPHVAAVDDGDDDEAGVFEIREYVDENGTLVNHQVVDLKKELEKIQSTVEEKQREASAPGSTEADEAKRAAARKVMDDLNSKLVDLDKSEPSAGKEDPEVSFVRELHELASRRDQQIAALRSRNAGLFDSAPDEGSVDDMENDGDDADADADEDDGSDFDMEFFESLAVEEERSKKQKERDRTQISEAGWGKGFLGGSSEKKQKQTTPHPPPAPAPATAPPAAKLPAASILKSSGDIAPAAFGGSIIERGF